MKNYLERNEKKEGERRSGRIFQGNCSKTRIEMLSKQENTFNKLRKKRKKRK